MYVSHTSRFAAMLASAALLITVAACQKENDPATPANSLAALPQAAAAPADNLSSPAKVVLGRALFWDPVLSGGREVSCSSCHHPATGYADGTDLAIGENGLGLGTARHFRNPNTIPFGQRNTSTVLNSAFNGLAADGTLGPTAAPMF